MKPGFKSLTGLLAILGIGDLAMVPSMIAANHHTAGTPPVPAIVATVIIGIATPVSAAGIARGWKPAFAVAMTCRIIDSISSALAKTPGEGAQRSGREHLTGTAAALLAGC
jgi:hypothetical protein